MNEVRWEQVRAVLEDALEEPPADRPQFIARACAGDEELQREVERYLSCDALAERVLPVTHWMEEQAAEPPELTDPERIGAYRILRRLGEGGMGVVYLAERDDGEYRKQVALKVLKPGLQRSRLLQLFRRERQILAQLQHPYIAQLMDGGTADGHTYYVMEYVEGVPVTTYCRERGLTVRQRLELFCRICHAVSYAHRRLVIHRDLKPGNILVTADGVPKLLDFGLARVFEAGAPGEPASVSIGPMLTPAYASPEQIRGEHLNTATDVYSLGVLLCELLTGQNPHLVAEQSPLEVCRAICEEDPCPPSRSAEPALRRQVAGDLDNIAMMALRKEPELRYASVEALRQDVERWMNGFPVQASTGTAYYRCRKYVGRHRWGLAVSGLAAVVALGIATTIWWEGRQAELRFEDVDLLAHSMIFEVHDAIRELPGSTAARQLLIDRALEYLKRLETTGGKNRKLQLELAAAYRKIGEVRSAKGGGNLGDTAVALKSLLKARQLLEAAANGFPDDLDTRQSLCRVYKDLADLYEQRGEESARLEASRRAAALEEALATRWPQVPKLKALALSYAAENLNMVADWRAARPLWNQAMTGFETALGQSPHDPEIPPALAATHEGMARCCNELNDLPCARKQYETLFRMRQADLEAAPDNTQAAMTLAFALIDLAWVEHRIGDYPNAIAHQQRALTLQQRLADADARDFGARLEVPKTLVTAGLIYRDAGNLDAAIRCLRQAAAQFEAALPHDAANQSTLFHVAWSNAELGDIYYRRLHRPGRSAAAMRSDWASAAAAYDRAASHLARLKLTGKLMGIQSDEPLRKSVASRVEECRAALR